MAGSIAFKSIKPQRMKDKNLRLELLNEIRKVGTLISKDFGETVKTWDHKPKFEQVISLSGNQPAVLVATDDEIYGYVDEGTKPHIIKPKKAKVLHFMGGYTAKTSPGVIGSGNGGSSGGEVFSRGVKHPGTKARGFSKAIEKKWQNSFRRHMEEAMSRAAKKSGHSI